MNRKKQTPLIRSDLLRYSGGFEKLIEIVPREVALRGRWARQYCRAAALALRLPGGGAYAYERSTPNRFRHVIWQPDPAFAATILAQAAGQLGAGDVLGDIWRAERLAGAALSRDVRYRLRHGTDAQTLAAAIDCLDRLLIAPVLPECGRFRDGCVRRPLAPERLPRFG